MRTKFSGISIKGISAALPKKILNLEELAELYGHNEVKKIMSVTGIRAVRVAENGLCTSDLCERAAKILLEALDYKPIDIDGIVFISQTPDYIMPATSTLLQARLGIPQDAVAFDIRYGCSGYIYGLYQASMLISSGGCKRVLLCVGDTTTHLVHPMDRASRMVFGDGGSATIVEAGDQQVDFVLKTNGAGANHLIVPAGGFRTPISAATSVEVMDEDGNIRSQNNLYMNGMIILNFVLREVPPLLNELMEIRGWDKNAVGTFALHQANKFILEYLARKMRLPLNSIPIFVDGIGNTGPASVPIMLTHEGERLRQEGRLENVIASGFGVGLSWAGIACNLSQTRIIEPIEV